MSQNLFLKNVQGRKGEKGQRVIQDGSWERLREGKLYLFLLD
jgi:hypothetical protein